MNTFIRFLYEFLRQFFSGFKSFFSGLLTGIKDTFSIGSYIKILNDYKNDFNGAEWVFVSLTIILLLILISALGFIIYFIIKKYLRFRKTLVEQEEMLEEIAKLNKEVAIMTKEKQDILSMKVSQLGLSPDEDDETEENAKPEEEENLGIRFAKLNEIDEEFKDYKIQNYGNTFTLEELVNLFRNFAASKLKLYYSVEMIRLFISAIASTKLIILQGISGTGKTSLAYAWGKFLKHDSCVASVQPSWRDRTELFGYFNEFTKKFNETEVLKEIYMAGYTDDIYTVILDEMNISRVEYYFAEML